MVQSLNISLPQPSFFTEAQRWRPRAGMLYLREESTNVFAGQQLALRGGGYPGSSGAKAAQGGLLPTSIGEGRIEPMPAGGCCPYVRAKLQG